MDNVQAMKDFCIRFGGQFLVDDWDDEEFAQFNKDCERMSTSVQQQLMWIIQNERRDAGMDGEDE